MFFFLKELLEQVCFLLFVAFVSKPHNLPFIVFNFKCYTVLAHVSRPCYSQQRLLCKQCACQLLHRLYLKLRLSLCNVESNPKTQQLWIRQLMVAILTVAGFIFKALRDKIEILSSKDMSLEEMSSSKSPFVQAEKQYLLNFNLLILSNVHGRNLPTVGSIAVLFLFRAKIRFMEVLDELCRITKSCKESMTSFSVDKPYHFSGIFMFLFVRLDITTVLARVSRPGWLS